MPDKDVVIKEVYNVLNEALNNAVKKRKKLDSTKWWTEAGDDPAIPLGSSRRNGGSARSAIPFVIIRWRRG